MSLPSLIEASRQLDFDEFTLNYSNPYVFLVGSPRSGTTMLKRMVNAHPWVAITRETHWIPRYYEKRKGVTEEGYVTERLVQHLFEHPRFEQMKFKHKALLKIIQEQPGLTYAALVSQIFDNYGRRKNKPLVGDKTPTYVRKLPMLHKLWPNARLVHLIRDGRDVWLSMKHWRMAAKSAGKFASWNVDPLVTTALWWKALVGIGRRDGNAIGKDLYREFKYEQLVAQPRDRMPKACPFPWPSACRGDGTLLRGTGSRGRATLDKRCLASADAGPKGLANANGSQGPRKI